MNTPLSLLTALATEGRLVEGQMRRLESILNKVISLVISNRHTKAPQFLKGKGEILIHYNHSLEKSVLVTPFDTEGMTFQII